MITNKIRGCIAAAAILAGPLSLVLPAAAEVPEAIAAHGEIYIATVQASGAQVYECKADASGKLVWQFREPVATLFMDGKTVGRHYAGPNWEMTDGSVIGARVSARAPGASGSDIPLLKLEVVSWRGVGQLSGVSTIQRINTQGGVAEGPCDTAGGILSAPYAADYVFFRKSAATQVISQPSVARIAPARATAPAYVAAPVVVAPRPFNIIVVRGNDRDRPKKKDPPGKGPKSPTGEPKSPPSKPTPPTAEPKLPPKSTTPPIVRDHRNGGSGGGVTTTSQPRTPKVRDHRGYPTASNDKPSGSGRPPSGSNSGSGSGSGSKPICGIGGTPPCLPK